MMGRWCICESDPCTAYPPADWDRGRRLNPDPTIPGLTHRIEPGKLRDSVVGRRAFHLAGVRFSIPSVTRKCFTEREKLCSFEVLADRSKARGRNTATRSRA